MLEFFASAAQFGSEVAEGVQHVFSSKGCINTSEIDHIILSSAVWFQHKEY